MSAQCLTCGRELSQGSMVDNHCPRCAMLREAMPINLYNCICMDTRDAGLVSDYWCAQLISAGVTSYTSAVARMWRDRLCELGIGL